jgi:hypothetical protein
MSKTRTMASAAAICMLLVLATFSIYSAMVFAEDTVIYRSETGKRIKFTYKSTEPLGIQIIVKPDVTYTYISIGDTLVQDDGNQYGPYTPYAISVKINTVSPSGYTLTVSIISGGQTKWSGELGAGQSSPTITVNGNTTYVRIFNQNSVTITYTGTITLINN